MSHRTTTTVNSLKYQYSFIFFGTKNRNPGLKEALQRIRKTVINWPITVIKLRACDFQNFRFMHIATN